MLGRVSIRVRVMAKDMISKVSVMVEGLVLGRGLVGLVLGRGLVGLVLG